MSTRVIRVGLLGCGTVGGGVIELIQREREAIAQRAGVRLEVTKALVRDAARPRGVDPAIVTDRPADVLNNGADVIVETLGGVDPAFAFVREALSRGRHVVTANKQLLAERHAELLPLAAARGVHFGYEASACAGVPVIRSLRDALAVDRPLSFEGVLNGTSTFILTRMEESGTTFAEALTEAQRRGFAEADPSDDIDGTDAARKLAILCGTAFGRTFRVSDAPTRGISGVTPFDIGAARRFGYSIRLVARAELSDEESIDVSVRPTLIPRADDLARLRGEQNILKVRCASCGELTFLGNGAGAGPTAIAILGDVLDAARMSSPPSRGAWAAASLGAGRPDRWFARTTAPARSVSPARLYAALERCQVRVTYLSFERDESSPGDSHALLMTSEAHEDQVVTAMRDGVGTAPLFLAQVHGASVSRTDEPIRAPART